MSSPRYLWTFLFIVLLAVAAGYGIMEFRSEVKGAEKTVKPGAYIEFRVIGPRESHENNAPRRKEAVRMTLIDSDGAQTEVTGTRTFAKSALICASDLTCGEDVIATKECGPLTFLYFKHGLYCLTCGELDERVSPLCPLKDERIRRQWASANWHKTYIDDPTINDPVEEFLKGIGR